MAKECPTVFLKAIAGLKDELAACLEPEVLAALAGLTDMQTKSPAEALAMMLELGLSDSDYLTLRKYVEGVFPPLPRVKSLIQDLLPELVPIKNPGGDTIGWMLADVLEVLREYVAFMFVACRSAVHLHITDLWYCFPLTLCSLQIRQGAQGLHGRGG